MKTSKNGIDLITGFEGCRINAYKALATEKYYTIGYGHYGADVKASMVISKDKAKQLLANDLTKFEAKVNKYQKYHWNQNEFDALVSFSYNVGSIDQLTAYGTRSRAEIAAKMMQYNKSGGKVIKGLTTRRTAERNLFIKPCGILPGCYKLTELLKVRKGAGMKYAAKKKEELTEAGQRICLDDGRLPIGCKVTVTKVVEVDDEYWGKIPSGYIAIKRDGRVFAEMV